MSGLNYWTAPRQWPGSTVFVVCSGPSVLQQDIGRLEGRHVIAINSSWAAVPFAQFMFFADARWWIEYKDKGLAAFRGRKVTTSNVIDRDVLNMRKLAPERIGVTEDPAALCMRRTSALGGMNLALHLGASRIVLVGCDGQAIAGRTHHHEPHRWPQKTNCWDEQRKDLHAAAGALERLGIEVLNASPDSTHPFWPRMNLTEALERVDDTGLCGLCG